MSEDGMSESDVALLRLVAAGRTTRQVADSVGEPRSKVLLQLRAIREQLSARNNVHAVVIAVRRGII
ncbi:hypothetical protein L2K70_01870 [Nocardioides KLBMP 9356]|uniref:HTH luxR-type domain-containing protein n=1 Tax=Nocardioides potassii TaxID=2911371 RepID=A0ABS9H510_9ACTN|nr:hypothetical protein [Nocardioides potassii]MCF6376346.1 hypothetical protein [Nocardioides potassii]